MAGELVADKRHWVIAAAGAAVVVAIAVLLVRVPEVPRIPPVAIMPIPNPAIVIQRGSSDHAALNDQAALFLPAERNASAKPLRRPEAGRSVLDYERERPTFGESELKLSLPSPVEVAENPVAAVLGDAPPVPLLGFGRTDAKVVGPARPARTALIEVASAATNRPMLSDVVPPEAKPPGEQAWRPMVFTANIGAAGLVGRLGVSESSGVEDVDNFFRNYLARAYRIGERLPPGFYRITVGP